MRLLLLSDVHANLDALEACLEAAPEHDAVVNLGDVVGYGGAPNECVELIRSLNPINVRGNHDRCCCAITEPVDFNPMAAEAVLWTRRQLSHENLEWLRQLPKGPVIDPAWKDVQFVHGSPLDEDIYIASELRARSALEVIVMHVTFFGHTHVQCAFAPFETLLPQPVAGSGYVQVTKTKLAKGMNYLVNPGSVGQPRDHDRRAAFAIYDSRKHEILFHRVPYDVIRAQERILEAGLPQMLALRLGEGR